LQNGLGTGPLLTGLGFLPLAVALAAGVRVGQHVLQHAGLRLVMAAGFATAAGGLLLLSAPTPTAANSLTSCPACS
jgi:hypothetical protein